jgi:hypothetical protein
MQLGYDLVAVTQADQCVEVIEMTVDAAIRYKAD